MSARTAKYVEALIREGDNFYYDRWLKRVREEDARAKQRSAPSNVDQAAPANIGNQVKTSHVGRVAATPLTRNARLPRAIRQPGQSLRGTTSAEPLRRWLEKVQVAWRRFQGNRARDAVYDYLEAVFAIVLHYKVRRRTKRLLLAAFRIADLRFDKNADPFIAVVRCTCSDAEANGREDQSPLIRISLDFLLDHVEWVVSWAWRIWKDLASTNSSHKLVPNATKEASMEIVADTGMKAIVAA
jgi:hypothetical protein